MIIRIFDKVLRELYRFFHPSLWGKKIQINGIPKIYCIKRLKIGSNVSINSGCVLQCYGGLEIGNNVTISDGAKILTRQLDTNNYCDNAKNIERKHCDYRTVICEGTWIATNALILPGATVPSNCIIAAGAVVNKNLEEENCLYAGVPAKKIRLLGRK
ncbi:transferase hexapeptide (six repeat-containing protein) [Butyrivibrio sp. Su6]|uniref:acyltransferase n=1 Tax=Butyrivibrio sp. Su6 TaxID=1520810 RepID=UPI00089E2014|nr:acyltransferase [Butyrivibrio sp. Su6]SEG16700.1 transferase hexapeptide (six repeat-containing protein) [Butyrivibrio sp. Su6]